MLAHFTGLLHTDDPRWRDVLAVVEHDFYHLPSYAALCAERDGGEALAFVHHGPDVTLLLPLILLSIGALGGARYATCPYGYPGIVTSPGALAAPVDRALDYLVDCLREARVVAAFARLHPLLELPAGALQQRGVLVAHGETVSLDLSAPLDESWRAMRSTHRRHILAAGRAGYVVQMGWEAVNEYVECYQQTMRRVSAEEQYLFDRGYIDRLRRALGDNVHLCTVSRSGEVACGGIFSEFGSIIQYHLGGTKDAFLVDSPMKLMFDFVRRWGHERGNRVLHLGGGVGGRADALFHFKAGFSERRHAFQTYRLVADDALYERSCQAAGVSADPRGYFPPFARGTTSIPGTAPATPSADAT